MATTATSAEVGSAFGTNTENGVLERHLWGAVLVRAIKDWQENTGHRKNAQRFLFEQNGDFNAVCLNAGLDPGHVRSALLKRVRRTIHRNGSRHTSEGLSCISEQSHYDLFDSKLIFLTATDSNVRAGAGGRGVVLTSWARRSGQS